MISEDQTMSNIQSWLNNWKISNLPPYEIVLDESSALIGACVKTFTSLLSKFKIRLSIMALLSFKPVYSICNILFGTEYCAMVVCLQYGRLQTKCVYNTQTWIYLLNVDCLLCCRYQRIFGPMLAVHFVGQRSSGMFSQN